MHESDKISNKCLDDAILPKPFSDTKMIWNDEVCKSKISDLIILLHFTHCTVLGRKIIKTNMQANEFYKMCKSSYTVLNLK